MVKNRERQILVTDHDGTLTNPVIEEALYEDIAIDYLIKELGIREEELVPMFVRNKQTIRNNPEIYGWEMNGLIVAPAISDCHTLNQTALSMMLNTLRSESKGQLNSLPSIEEQEAFMYKFFITTSKTLENTGSHYRLGASDYIRELSTVGNLVIVTNSGTDIVQRKLQTLLGDEANYLILMGNARKYIIDPNWIGQVPQGKYFFPGFPDRGVYLQRKNYYDILLELADGDIKRVAICGDIPEMDTLMADYIGCRTALVESSMTPKWESAYYRTGDGRRFASTELGDIASWLIRK